METVVVALKGPGGKFGRILADSLGNGPFGWYPIIFDMASPDDDCKFDLTQPDQRYKLVHQKTNALFGMDATQFLDANTFGKQFYGKPTDVRGAYESPVVCYDPIDNNLLFLYVPYYNYKFVSCGLGVIKL